MMRSNQFIRGGQILRWCARVKRAWCCGAGDLPARFELVRAAFFVGMIFACAGSVSAQQTNAGEYAVKGAFLYNFAKFVEWPEGTFTSDTQPFTFCVLGKDPFGRALDSVLLGKKIGNHPVQLVRAPRLSLVPDCQVIFAASAGQKNISEILEAFHNRSVLLVGETEDFAGAGGTIQFFLEGNRVRFAINTDAAGRAKLKISSKLLGLAAVVHDSDAGGKN